MMLPQAQAVQCFELRRIFDAGTVLSACVYFCTLSRKAAGFQIALNSGQKLACLGPKIARAGLK